MDKNNVPFRAVFEGKELNISSEVGQPQQPAVSNQKSKFGLTKFIMMHSGGFLNDEKRVNYFFIGVIIITIAILLYSLLTSIGTGTKFEGFPGQ